MHAIRMSGSRAPKAASSCYSRTFRAPRPQPQARAQKVYHFFTVFGKNFSIRPIRPIRPMYGLIPHSALP